MSTEWPSRSLSTLLDSVRATHWLPQFTDDLIDLLNILGIITKSESSQRELLVDVNSASQITSSDLHSRRIFPVDKVRRKGATEAMSSTGDTVSRLLAVLRYQRALGER
jgi:hypothetical protein